MNSRADIGKTLIPLSVVSSQTDFFQRLIDTEMSSRSLPSRITPLTDSLKEIQHLNTRLSILGTTPGSTPTNPEEGDTRVELAEEIHQSLKELEEEFELVRQEVEDQTNTSSFTRRRDSERERERANLAALVTRLGGDLKSWALANTSTSIVER